MNTDWKKDETMYRVVVNHDERLSIGDPLVHENALDWRDMGKTSSSEASMAHIKECWTVMRLFSLKKKAGGRSRSGGSPPQLTVKVYGY